MRFSTSSRQFSMVTGMYKLLLHIQYLKLVLYHTQRVNVCFCNLDLSANTNVDDWKRGSYASIVEGGEGEWLANLSIV